MKLNPIILLLFFLPQSLLAQTLAPVAAQETFQELIKKDLIFPNLKLIRLRNSWGKVFVHGWAQEKIRIQMTRFTKAETSEEAQERFKEVVLHSQENSGTVEIIIRIGKSFSISERIQAREKRKVKIDLEVWLPQNIPFALSTKDDEAQVDNYIGEIDMWSQFGALTINNITSSEIMLNCVKCQINVSKSEIKKIDIYGGEGEFNLSHLKIDKLYFEGQKGNLEVSNIFGNQTYLLKNGKLKGTDLSGEIYFKSENTDIDLKNIEGTVSGKNGQGNINLDVKKWITKSGFIQTRSGNINLFLPTDNKIELDLASQQGKVKVDEGFYGFLNKKNHDNTSLLKVKTWSGQIYVKKR